MISFRSVNASPRFAAKIELITRKAFKALPLDEMRARDEEAGRETLGRFRMWTYADKVMSENGGFSKDATICTIWSNYSDKAVVLHHMVPACFEAKDDLLRFQHEYPQEVHYLESKESPVRGFILGGDPLKKASVGGLKLLKRLFDQHQLPTSVLWGHRDEALVSHAHFSVPENHWRISISDGLQRKSIMSLEELKQRLSLIRIAEGDELVIDGKPVSREEAAHGEPPA